MAKVYLASSAIPDFDGIETIRAARDAHFDGAQLYLDERYRSFHYRQITILCWAQANIGLMIHLPNVMHESDYSAARDIAEKVPEAKFLIHYLPTTSLPKINQVPVGWENSITGKFDPEHILTVQSLAERQQAPFVFDIGRSLYSTEGYSWEDITVFTIGLISSMKSQDIVHFADKSSLEIEFRKGACALGQGICGIFIDNIRRFNGIAVTEHEDLQMAVESLKVLKE